MTTQQSSLRFEITLLVLALFFISGFLCVVGYAAINYADEGPSVKWVPPAYTIKNTK